MYRDPDRYEVRRGGGCLMLFGLPFLAAGLFVIGMGLSGKMSSKSGKPPPLYFIVPFGLVFAAAGAGLMFGRAGIVIDKRSRTVTKWWGLIVPFSSKSFPADKVSAVTISREVRTSHSSKGGSSSYTVYPVRLAGPAKPVDVEEPRDYAKARRRAEEVAKFLDLGVEDSSSGEKVVREAGTLDESLRERYRREGRPRERPKEPAGCRIVSGASLGEAAFDVPPKGFGLQEVVMAGFGGLFLVGSTVFGLGFLARFLFGKDGGASAPLPVIIFVAVFALVWISVPLGLVLGAIASATARERVTVSPREIRLERRSFIRTKRACVPADELEELEIGTPTAGGFSSVSVGAGRGKRLGVHPMASFFGRKQLVTARSDRATMEFGAGLRPEELEWLRDVIMFIATA